MFFSFFYVANYVGDKHRTGDGGNQFISSNQVRVESQKDNYN